MVGKVVGVCMSQRRTDPKKNIGKSFLQKGLGLVGDSHAGTEKEVSLLAVESIHNFSSTADEGRYFVSPYKHWHCSLKI
jgi:hypothetical protein